MKALKPNNKLSQCDVPRMRGVSIDFGLMVTNMGITKHTLNAKGELENGIWLDESHLLKCLSQIKSVASDNVVKEPSELQIIPSNLLFENEKVVCWYQEVAQSFHVFFNADSIPSVPHPRLVFLVKKNDRNVPTSMYVYAIDSTVSRPTLSTALSFAPCGNLYRQSNLCLGSATLPKKITASELTEAENTLLLSRYTGFKFESINLSFNGESHDSCIDVLRSLSNKNSFPDSALKLTGETLGDVLKTHSGAR